MQNNLSVLLWYSTTLFVSAFLLFLVQPMVGKMVLPLFGGVPAVWNTCMVFFQVSLLIGYAYTHISIKWLGPRRQALLHVVLLLAPLTVLPILITHDSSPSAGTNPMVWLLGSLLVKVGLPFFAVSSTAPLLQRWFASVGHPLSGDPYFLYAASNFGSFLALLGYPVVFEPLMTLSQQSRIWSGVYGLLILMMVICGVMLWRTERTKVSQDNSARSADPLSRVNTPSGRLRLFWIFASFVPSSLMLGVTTHITTNLASLPLLWVLPLALYLLSFIFVFARKKILPHTVMVKIMPLIIIPAAPIFFVSIKYMEWLIIPAHLFLFFITVMVCHGELARSRPSAQYLTEFYLLISCGGVLGGFFNALAAPVLFNRTVEYPLVMILACLLMPGSQPGQRKPILQMSDVLFPMILACFNFAIIFSAKTLEVDLNSTVFVLFFGPAALVCYGFKQRPARFALTFGMIIISIAVFFDLQKGEPLYTSRNFFGVKRVVINPEGNMRELYHGSILHGAQLLDPGRKNEPTTYFHQSGPIGDIFSVFNTADMKPVVAVIGLGTGSIASYARPGQHFVFYEIDPAVKQIAQDRLFFSFLENAQMKYDIVIGDGRLTMNDAHDYQYGMIILDAFSSDAIPIHLLTKEAIELYVSKIVPEGILAFHISNRFLELEPLMGRVAKELGLECLARQDLFIQKGKDYQGKKESHYVIMGRSNRVMSHFLTYSDWYRVSENPEIPLWTDKYSNIISLLRW